MHEPIISLLDFTRVYATGVRFVTVRPSRSSFFRRSLGTCKTTVTGHGDRIAVAERTGADLRTTVTVGNIVKQECAYSNIDFECGDHMEAAAFLAMSFTAECARLVVEFARPIAKIAMWITVVACANLARQGGFSSAERLEYNRSGIADF
ncbi:hypothetical protein WA026_007026 [Henosepilachna vigintioctopunctata]|uniref:Uncharacterized protein n=1 Tax=Henosepilachna vigintioctopunctata TaxID=420089 RepID=A0AAW1V7X0_9CUCU